MPRPIVNGGLRGPAQEFFPEDAKQEALRLGMEDEDSQVTILRNEGTKQGGVKSEKWEPIATDVRANVINAPFGAPRGRYPVAEQITESTTHIFHIDPVVEVEPSDRIQRGSELWAILVVGTRTEQATIYVEAKQL